jgi:hypothetical protein
MKCRLLGILPILGATAAEIFTRKKIAATNLNNAGTFVLIISVQSAQSSSTLGKTQ